MANTTQSEPRTGLDDLTSLFSRNLVAPAKKFAAAAALAVALEGCTAPGYTPSASPKHDEMHAEYVKSTFGDVDAFSKEVMKALDNKEAIAPYKTPDTLDTSAAQAFKALPDKESLDTSATYTKIKDQNKALNQIFESGKVQRLVIFDATQNANVDCLQQYADMTPDDAKQMRQSLIQLYASLQNTKKEQRDQLKKALAGNKEADELFARNEKDLVVLDKITKALSAISTLEGRLDLVVDSQQGSAAINKSLYGVQQYDARSDDGSTVQGVGRQVLNSVLAKNIDEICDPKSKVSLAYGDRQGQKLQTIYDDNLAKIGKEAQDWGTHSLHKVCNEYLANNLSIAFEAYEHERITKDQLQAVVRVITSDAYAKLGSAMPKKASINGWDVALAIVPFGSVYTLFAEGPYALASAEYDPKTKEANVALAKLFVEGNAIEHGVHNRNWIAGDYSRTPFIVAGISTGVQLVGVGAGLYFGFAGKGGHHKSSPNASTPATPPVGGGGSTGAGIK